MLLLQTVAGVDRLKLIAYFAMVKAVRIFKGLVKREDYKENE